MSLFSPLFFFFFFALAIHIDLWVWAYGSLLFIFYFPLSPLGEGELGGGGPVCLELPRFV